MDAPKDLELMHKRVVFSILQYLNGLTQGGAAVPAGLDKEGLEVAVQCIASAFGVDPANSEHQSQFAVPFQLTDIYNYGLLHLAQQQQAAAAEAPKPTATPAGQEVPKELEGKFQTFLNVLEGKGFFTGLTKGTTEYQDRYNLAKQRFLSQYSSTQTTPAPAPAPAAVDPAAQLQEAEKFKALGNEKLSAGLSAEAIELYNKAIALNPSNAVYYGNRAAAHSTLQQHESAIVDCKRAIELDPKYIKAYSRLGFSLFSLGKYTEAIDLGYKRVLEIDPENTAAQESMRLCQQKLGQSAPQAAAPAASPLGGPGMAGLAQMMSSPEMQNSMRQMFGGSDGAPPDLNNLLGNPQVMNAAQQMMSSPQFSQILNNPLFMNMAQNLMQNPSQLNQMFSQMGGPAGAQQGEDDDNDNAQQ